MTKHNYLSSYAFFFILDKNNIKKDEILEKHLINKQIRDPQVLVVDENGTKLGVMKTFDAINLAQNKDLDLVLFVPKEVTKSYSICKIIDYGRFAYQQQIKLKQSKKNQHEIKIKEVKVRPQVGKHDLEWKAKQVIDWLKQGYQIKFKVMAFGRIGTKTELIDNVFNTFMSLIQEFGKPQQPLKQVSPVLYETTIVKK